MGLVSVVNQFVGSPKCLAKYRHIFDNFTSFIFQSESHLHLCVMQDITEVPFVTFQTSK